MPDRGIVASEGKTELAGKYLTFRLGEEEFGVEILKVREIIGLMGITVVPRTPSFIRGVINLRGKIIPVVDLRLKFAMSATQDTELTCIIVVDMSVEDQNVQMGILVDSVSEVLDIPGSSIEPTPAFGAGVNTNFILGMARIENEVKILLHIEDVLNTSEMLDMVQNVGGGSATAEATVAA